MTFVKQNEFRTVQKNADLVDLEKCCKNEPTLAIWGVDTAENGLSKVWPTLLPTPDRPSGQIKSHDNFRSRPRMLCRTSYR